MIEALQVLRDVVLIVAGTVITIVGLVVLRLARKVEDLHLSLTQVVDRARRLVGFTLGR